MLYISIILYKTQPVKTKYIDIKMIKTCSADVYLKTHTRTHAHARTHTYTHARVYARTHTNTRTHTHACPHTHTHTHTHNLVSVRASLLTVLALTN